MKTALAIRHIAFEDLGLLRPLLEARGYAIEYHDAAADRELPPFAGEVDLLVVLGGPMDADDFDGYPNLRQEVDALRLRRERDLPTLGICLGAQLMALSLGGQVRPMPSKEIGWAPVRLSAHAVGSGLAGLGAEDAVLHWHGDEILLPPGIEALAMTEACAVQAFQWSARGLALQFHLEADPARIGEWTRGHAEELAGAGMDGATLVREATALRPVMPAVAARVLGHWLDTLG
ncbi:MAG TPA: glutamine amidotransferase [Stenotrophomonas sp.]